MNGLYYLLEANLYLSILYLVYRLLLRQETFYLLNRWYLIGLLFVSFSLPFLGIENSSTKINSSSNQLKTTKIGDPHALDTLPAERKEIVRSETFPKEKLQTAIWVLYVIVVIQGMLKFLWRIKTVITLFKRSAKYRVGQITHVWITEHQQAFSFFKWLFYHPGLKPHQAIVCHEMVHINQKHSADVLLFELIKVFNWINPLMNLMCKDVKLNHEFLADEKACQSTPNKHAYAMLLIDHAHTGRAPQISSAIFNSEQLQQRIIKLGKSRSGRLQKLKYLLSLPLLIMAVVISCITIPKSYVLMSLHINSNRNAINDDPPTAEETTEAITNSHEPGAGNVIGQSPPAAQQNRERDLKVQRPAKTKTLISSSEKERPNTLGLGLFINGANHGEPMNINSVDADTTGLLIAKPEYINGQVGVNRSPADTTQWYLVQQGVKDGQVKINRVKSNPE